ncbi:histidine phosphatase family protein [Candidatus Shapirobacteria bacterium]|nr:histidine phosphatase family protein [Candidatus Shapirobacteria bacterium]
MSTIYLFRHGQTDFNEQKKFTGWLNSTLTENGIMSAQTIADSLRLIKIDLAYHTRLQRSVDTLNIVLKDHPECKEILVDDRMIERSYGDLAGLTHQEIIDGLGIGQYEEWHRGFYDEPPQGESFDDVEKRVLEFMADLKSKYSGKNLNIVISAHGNSIRLFRKIMENATIEEAVSWVIPYDQYFEYKI